MCCQTLFNWGVYPLKKRRLIANVQYGGLSHANPLKKKLYDEWTSIPAIKNLAENEFVYIISSIYKAIGWIKDLNDRVLIILTSTTTP